MSENTNIEINTKLDAIGIVQTVYYAAAFLVLFLPAYSVSTGWLNISVSGFQTLSAFWILIYLLTAGLGIATVFVNFPIFDALKPRIQQVLPGLFLFWAIWLMIDVFRAIGLLGMGSIGLGLIVMLVMHLLMTIFMNLKLITSLMNRR